MNYVVFFLLVVLVPYEPSCPFVGWSVCWFVGRLDGSSAVRLDPKSVSHNFLRLREVTLPWSLSKHLPAYRLFSLFSSCRILTSFIPANKTQYPADQYGSRGAPIVRHNVPRTILFPFSFFCPLKMAVSGFCQAEKGFPGGQKTRIHQVFILHSLLFFNFLLPSPTCSPPLLLLPALPPSSSFTSS